MFRREFGCKPRSPRRIVGLDHHRVSEGGEARPAQLQRRSYGHPGNQPGDDGVRLAVAHAKRWLNISSSSIPNRGARC